MTDVLPEPPATLAPVRHRPAAWQVGLAGVAAIGVTFGFARYGYGLFAPDIREQFGLSVGLVGVIGSATYVGYLTALLIVGVFADRIGPRMLVVFGGASATLGMSAVAVAQDPALLVIGLVLAGTSPGWAWAPYSDAVDRVVEPSKREKIMALIPSGTAFGVLVAGPLALLMHGSSWRYAWFVFAAVSLAVTIYNAVILPGRASVLIRRQSQGIGWAVRRIAVPLYITAFSYGLTGAVYWSFAVEVISAQGQSGSATAPLFWTLMGAAGTLGVLAGMMLARLGLRISHAVILVAMAVAIALLGVAPGFLPAVGASAILYGPGFMAGSSLLAVWSYQVFPERPTSGFSATVFFLGLGAIAGPVTLGAFADGYGLREAFLLTAAIMAATLLVWPAKTKP